MTARPVVEELAETRARLTELYQTPCAGCGHPFVDHNTGRCWKPKRYGRENLSVPGCSCKRFVDPVASLLGIQKAPPAGSL